MLLLALTLLSTAQIVAAKKGEEKAVSFTGDLEGSGTMTFDGRGTNLAVYGGIDLTFSGTFGSLAGMQDCKLRITIKGRVRACEASMGCDFDWYYNDEVNARVPLYHLVGSGTTSSVDGTYTINLDAAIYEVVPHRRGKKGAIGLEFVEPPVWEGAISFDMTI